ncbi:hypothetical protein LJC07_06490, partial [Christensenellaceae bacterium OttesenSCG-928-L17]|nr:hypothetical protein [Christensenellaceae bacterium OttesenSCG-928-L17]
ITSVNIAENHFNQRAMSIHKYSAARNVGSNIIMPGVTRRQKMHAWSAEKRWIKKYSVAGTGNFAIKRAIKHIT